MQAPGRGSELLHIAGGRKWLVRIFESFVDRTFDQQTLMYQRYSSPGP